jgi:effector-binding domain-containing protein
MDIYSKITKTDLPEMKVVSAWRISNNPEDEVIRFLHDWMNEKGIAIANCRSFGFDIPVSEADIAAGKRGYEFWLSINDDIEGDDQVTVKTIPADFYLTLRITDPFSDPFTRIGNGWKLLAEEARKLNENNCCCSSSRRYCLEEVIEEKGITYMDIFCPV